MKEFKTLDEQLQILHRRGLSFNDYKKAKQYLLTNNYYNIINGYSKYFYVSTDVYISGATFDEISSLYFFDKELKHAFFKAIIDAEAHTKYIISHRFAEVFQSNPYPYLDINIYDSTQIKSANYTISKFSKIIGKYKKLESSSSIKHYEKVHSDVPVWVLVDYLTYGEVRFFLSNLQLNLRNRVAKNMCSFLSEHTRITQPFTPEIMLSYMKNIEEVRNRCAHKNKLLGHKCHTDLKYFRDLHQKYGIKNTDQRNDIYNVFIVLQCFLTKTQYAQLHNTIRQRIKLLERRLVSIDVNLILKSLGFPIDWHKNTDKLPQI